MMPHRFVRSLKRSEQRQIEEVFRQGPNARTRRRAQAIRLSARGYSVPEVADILGCNAQSVRNWFDAFELGGVAALLDRPRSGRPVVATHVYRRRLVRAIRSDPMKFGYPFTVWTITRIRAHLARDLNILLSESRVRQIMKEEGLVFKRPKHSLAGKRDADAFAEVRDILDRAKKSPYNPIPA